MLGASRLMGAALRRGPLLGVSRLSSASLPGVRVCFFVQQPPRARSPSLLTSLVTRRTSSSLSKASEDVATAIDGMSHMERLKDLWRKYGVVAIGTYLTMYGTVLGSIYLAIDQGWVRTNKRSISKGDDQSDESFNLVTTTNKFVKIAEDLGIAQYLEVERVSSKSGTFLLAWIATKFTEPVRLAVTLAATPRIARFLGRAPKLPPKAASQLMARMKKKQPPPKEQQKQ